MDNKQKAIGWKKFIDLIKETKPSKLLLFVAISMSVLTTLIGLVIPLFTRDLVNSFSISSLNPTIIVALVIAFIAQAIASGLSIYLLNHIGQNVVSSLRDRLWNKFIILPVSYFDEHKSGELASRMTNDTGIIKQLITNQLTNFFTGIISVVGSTIVLLILDWKMTIMMMISLPVSLLVVMPLGKKMYNISKELQDETAHFTAIISQVLSEIRLVKASNAESFEYRNGNKKINSLFHLGLQEGKIQAMISPAISLIMMGVLVVIIGYGGMRVSSGALTAGDLVAFILYLFQIFTPMTDFASFFTQLQKAKGATERVIFTLEQDEEKLYSGKKLGNIRSPLTVEGLTFYYEKGKRVLNNVNFTVNPGEITAIVGPSGGGKTTIFSLLERYYLPCKGIIKIGDNMINDFSLYSWRKKISYVSQESPLIDGTIRDNIVYGIEDKVSESQVENVAKMAYADQFISYLSKGYQTEVGERGIKLSGGQRQRIGIARALLRNPEMLMLDEATSSLDSKSEVYVQKALRNLMNGRTTLVIAHRLSTVIDANQIIFVDQGEVTGVGTHDELLQSHSIYQEFANQQLQTQETA